MESLKLSRLRKIIIPQGVLYFETHNLTVVVPPDSFNILLFFSPISKFYSFLLLKLSGGITFEGLVPSPEISFRDHLLSKHCINQV